MESSLTRHFPRWIEAAQHGLINQEGGLSSNLKIQANKSKFDNARDDERKRDEVGRGRGC
jgi:hypothetical protein